MRMEVRQGVFVLDLVRKKLQNFKQAYKYGRNVQLNQIRLNIACRRA
jgi:hypothetical protein